MDRQSSAVSCAQTRSQRIGTPRPRSVLMPLSVAAALAVLTILFILSLGESFVSANPSSLHLAAWRRQLRPISEAGRNAVQAAPTPTEAGPDTHVPQANVAPSVAPNVAPSVAPNVAPSGAPNVAPSVAPNVAPPAAPNVAPSVAPIDLRRRPRVKVTGWIGVPRPYPLLGVGTAGSNFWRIDDLVLRIAADSFIEGDVQTDAFATAIAAVDDDGQLVAQSVSLRPLPGEIGYPLEFRCLIQEIGPRYWIVCNRVVLITQNTSVQGRPEIGSLAEVKGVRLTGNTVLARSVKVTIPDAYAEVEFEGSIESLADSAWIVNGITVTITPVTVVRGVAELGLTAEVKGILQPNGSVLAQSITVKDAGPTLQVDIEGRVEEIEPTYWQVAGTQVFVDSSTFIDDSRAPAEVGMWAQVRALTRLDGSLLAQRIRLGRPD